MVRDIGAGNMYAVKNILCFISFILTIYYHDFPRKSPSILMAVNETYITYLSLDLS